MYVLNVQGSSGTSHIQGYCDIYVDEAGYEAPSSTAYRNHIHRFLECDQDEWTNIYAYKSSMIYIFYWLHINRLTLLWWSNYESNGNVMYYITNEESAYSENLPGINQAQEIGQLLLMDK